MRRFTLIAFCALAMCACGRKQPPLPPVPQVLPDVVYKDDGRLLTFRTDLNYKVRSGWKVLRDDITGWKAEGPQTLLLYTWGNNDLARVTIWDKCQATPQSVLRTAKTVIQQGGVLYLDNKECQVLNVQTLQY